MIIKLDTSIFRLAKLSRTEKAIEVSEPLTKAQWITADRIVIGALFILAIVGALLF